MGHGRLTLDILFDMKDKSKIEDYWTKLKADKEFFQKITATGEESTVRIHVCKHDDTPPAPCKVIKEIVMTKVMMDDTLE